MTDNLLKSKLIEVCIGLIDDHIQTSYNLIKEIEQSAAEYGLPKDRYDSFRTQLSRRREGIVQQIMKAEEDLKIFNRIDLKKTYRLVEFGALVITEKQKILISTGLGKVEYQGQVYFAVSHNVPVVESMKGKKKGDFFEFRGERVRIIDIL